MVQVLDQGDAMTHSLRSPRSQTLVGNGKAGNSVSGESSERETGFRDAAFPNRVWEREVFTEDRCFLQPGSDVPLGRASTARLGPAPRSTASASPRRHFRQCAFCNIFLRIGK